MTKIAATLGIMPGITAVIGSGGKSTLLSVLGEELSSNNRVVLTTTTKMFPPEKYPVYSGADSTVLKNMLSANGVATVGSIGPNGKFTQSAIPFSSLIKEADYVIAESDGSKRLPLKAHRYFEPVIPEGCNHTVCVLGMSGIGKTVNEAVHCPELYAQRAGCSVLDTVTPEIAASVLIYEYAMDARLRFETLILNQTETPDSVLAAKTLAYHLRRSITARIFYGNIRKGELICLY